MRSPLVPIASAGPGRPRRAVLVRRIRWLVAATIGYNVVEAGVAITAGTASSSTALLGFGLDSVIEVSSAAAVAWQFAGRDPADREKSALRIIAFSFFALAAYVGVASLRALLGDGEAEHSTVGIVLAALSLAVMPALSYAQRRAGRELGSRSAVADSRQTLLCTCLAAVLLVGLGLNSLFGWAWADPAAALLIAVVAGKEGRDAWRGDTCCTPTIGPDTTTTGTEFDRSPVTATTSTASCCETDTAKTSTAGCGETDTVLLDIRPGTGLHRDKMTS